MAKRVYLYHIVHPLGRSIPITLTYSWWKTTPPRIKRQSGGPEPAQTQGMSTVQDGYGTSPGLDICINGEIHTIPHPIREGCYSDPGRFLWGSPCGRLHMADRCPGPKEKPGFTWQ